LPAAGSDFTREQSSQGSKTYSGCLSAFRI
ncbi:unnamed protein product, partial [Caretta caretta]